MRTKTIQSTGNSDRGLSVALTHVLAIGITTILIAVLLAGSSALLDAETDRSAEQSLETIGERLAGEVANVDAIGDEDTDTVTLSADHPRTVAGSGYTVELLESDDCADSPLLTGDTNCLRLTASGADVQEYVPVKIDADVGDDRSASGGLIEIEFEYDGNNGEISIRSGN